MRFISKKFLVVFLTLLAISMMTPVTAAGTTWYVDGSGGADYTSIQAAVDVSGAGDTIIVRDGTYTENVDIKVAHLSILSENGSDSTIVQAADMSDHVFNVTKDYVNISGFTVEDAKTYWGIAGVYLDSIENCNISNINATNNVFGIILNSVENSNISIINASNNEFGISLSSSRFNTITNNNANSNWNYGIILDDSSYNILENNNVNSNAEIGIYLRNSCNHNTLTGNTVLEDVGCILIENLNDNNLIYNNYFNNAMSVDSGNNIWNITKTPETNIIGGPYLGGNYWSGYSGFDTDEDGLGDTSYSITGGSNQDMFPLVKDFFISCDSSGDEKNMFMPGEGIYVKAEGLSPSTSYKVWIQDNPVNDGDALIASEDPSGIQEVVTSDGSGSISPTLIWDIPSDAAVTHHEYDIVLDNQSGTNVGVYNSASDRIDSAIAAGVTAPVPELTSIAMVLMGIAVILGYVRNNKEK
ncbi:MAG: NosD domain-containing protein [Halobacteriota archaeon]|nr:NosD domain-containing protein [Halobacteriota archaeon]